jgi:hypothetical protein
MNALLRERLRLFHVINVMLYVDSISFSIKTSAFLEISNVKSPPYRRGEGLERGRVRTSGGRVRGGRMGGAWRVSMGMAESENWREMKLISRLLEVGIIYVLLSPTQW